MKVYEKLAMCADALRYSRKQTISLDKFVLTILDCYILIVDTMYMKD